MSADVVCKKCGEDVGWYRNVEVSGTGWADVEITGNDDGSVEAVTDSHVQDIEYDSYMRNEAAFGCVGCGYEAHKITDLVEVIPEEIDEVKWRQKNPIPGQTTLEV